jgi:hypothetical protein
MNCFLWQLFHCNALSPLVWICCSCHPNLHHKFGRNCSHQLDSCKKVFISSLLPLLGRMHNYCLLLLMWFPFMVPEPSSCDPCTLITWSGQGVTWTLLYHTHLSCQGTMSGICRHNKTTYFISLQESQYTCFDPQYSPNSERLQVRNHNKKAA